jgi:hypothetical protein
LAPLRGRELDVTYTDHDGDVILETIDELRLFAGSTPCESCRAEALLMLAVFAAGGSPVAIVFSTTCEHD